MVVIDIFKVYSVLLDSGPLPVEGHLRHKLIDSFFLVNGIAFDKLQ